MGEIRLNKIIRKYNIGIQNLIEFLKTKGGEAVREGSCGQGSFGEGGH